MSARPEFNSSISLGNVIQIAILIVGIAASWVAMEYRGQMNAERLTELRKEGQELSIRVRVLENAKARDDERFSSILQFMSRIDSRLERIEQSGR